MGVHGGFDEKTTRVTRQKMARRYYGNISANAAAIAFIIQAVRAVQGFCEMRNAKCEIVKVLMPLQLESVKWDFLW